MKLKQWAAACAVVVAGPAMAGLCTTKTLDWGNLGPPAFMAFGNTLGVGSFNDCYTFNLSDNANGFGGTVEIDNAFNTLDINISAVSLYAGLNLIRNDSTPGSFEFDNLAAGDYTLVVRGNVASVAGFLPSKVGYAGAVVTLAAPVPEPEAYAMMLAGFLGVGVGVLRRKKS